MSEYKEKRGPEGSPKFVFSAGSGVCGGGAGAGAGAGAGGAGVGAGDSGGGD